MARIVFTILVRLALCSAVTWYFYRTFELVAVVVAAPAFGVALARPLIDLFAEIGHHGKTHALAGLQGRYWSHRGARIDVAQDDEGARWLLAADVRKVIGGLPRDEVLGKQFGDRAGVVESVEGFRIRADALGEYLQKSTDAASLRFRTWLDREVMGGGRNPRLR